MTYPILDEDRPFFDAIKKIAGDNVTSNTIDVAVQDVVRENYKNGIFTPVYFGADVIRIMLYHDLISIQSHLGQPRHGQLINGGRLHKIRIFEYNTRT